MLLDKKQLRSLIRARKKAADTAELARQSQLVCRYVIQHPEWQQADAVLLYHSLPDEVDTSLLLQQTDKRILLPIVVGDELQLGVYDGRLKEGAYGIMEPDAVTGMSRGGYPSLGRLLCVVPGMAFDRQGHRLGRGKGYYDRLFASMLNAGETNIYKMGICYDFQLLDEVSSEVHDVVMDEVVCVPFT